MDWRIWGEDNADRKNLIGPGGNPRRVPMRTFRGNTAHTNYYQGFILANFEQFYTYRDEVHNPIFENMKAYRNREQGIYTRSKYCVFVLSLSPYLSRNPDLTIFRFPNMRALILF